jgi:hypothetical protein
MKFLLGSLVIFLIIQSCKEPVRLAFRPTEGHLDTIYLDTKTPLKKLISRLQKPWEFVETGKAYWIGYTDDMYSIAYYQDKAVIQLIDLIKRSDSQKTKIGALITLHLIGIHSQVVGRNYEEFSDTLARNAILSFIADKQLQNTAIMLLRRDPWKYDIPFFISYLNQLDSTNLDVFRYIRTYLQNVDGVPLWQDLPQTILEKEISIKTNNFFSHPIADIIALKKSLEDKVEIDDEILETKEWKNGLKAFQSDTGEVKNVRYINEKEYVFEKPHIKDIKSFREGRDYEGIFPDDRFLYSYENGIIYIIGYQKARSKLLTWWNNLSSEDRIKTLSDNKQR